MTLFLIAAAVLILLATAVMLWPLMRRLKTVDATESPALKILREQRADIEADHAAGKLSDAHHAQTLAEIEARALEEADVPERAATHKPRLAWAIAVGVVLPVAAIAIYLIIGNPEGLDPAKRVAQREEQITPEQINAMVEKLAERVKANPDDIQALQMLGRSYMVLSRFGDAAGAFARLATKQPDNSQAFADWADAVAGAQGRSLAGSPEKLIVKALAIDPNNIKALALSGTLAFERQDFKQAITQWQNIAARVPAESEFGQSVQSMIAEARKRAGMPAEQAAASGPASTPTSTAGAPPASALKLKGHVTLSAALRSQVGKDDVLFIFARPEAGGPPVSGMRFSASELPLDFYFSQAQMMMGSVGPQDKVIIGARISKRGNAMPASGDLQGFSKPVQASATGVQQIEISETVK